TFMRAILHCISAQTQQIFRQPCPAGAAIRSSCTVSNTNAYGRLFTGHSQFAAQEKYWLALLEMQVEAERRQVPIVKSPTLRPK
ncbi:MAG: hypothetical protein ACYC7I_09540, partial [Gammaproteobacteria bacterium]